MKQGVIKKKSKAMRILGGIGLTGMVILAATSPYFGIGLIRGLRKYNKKNKKEEWRKFYASLNYLNKRGYVKFLNKDRNSTKVKITRKGEGVIKDFDIDSLKLKKQKSWDGKWRVIIFDVPVNKNANRKAFTDKIKELGFVMIQKSVWAYPFKCYEELILLRKFYGVERYVAYFEVVNVEDGKDWRGKFNLRLR